MASVDYDVNNWEQCLCANCPVQEKSQCSMDKKPVYQESLNTAKSGESQMPDRQNMIGLYCTNEVGNSSCNDLNCDALCQCAECSVFKSNSLNDLQFCI